jgi:hypothetical protein
MLHLGYPALDCGTTRAADYKRVCAFHERSIGYEERGCAKVSDGFVRRLLLCGLGDQEREWKYSRKDCFTKGDEKSVVSAVV